MADLELLVPLSDSMDRIVATVAGLSAGAVASPSAIPPWTRGHVASHLARNADSIVRLLSWAATGVVTPQYASPESRDAEIEAGASRPVDELVADLRTSFVAIETAARLLPAAAWAAPIALRGGEPATASRVLSLRLREQEIHHADLDAGYGFADIPDPLVGLIILDIRTSAVARADSSPLRVQASDSDFACEVGTGGPTVAGPQADLLAWLSGRSTGASLTGSTGALPDDPHWI